MPQQFGFGQPTSYLGTLAPTAVITAGSSPFTYTPPQDGVVIVTGGTVSAIKYVDSAGTATSTGLTAGCFHVSTSMGGLQVTYSAAPTITFVQD